MLVALAGDLTDGQMTLGEVLLFFLKHVLVPLPSGGCKFLSVLISCMRLY
jgi:hypothetical protein